MLSQESELPEPRVSVIIPNWNGAKFLVTCLDSLRRQTFRDFETIVVDNASTDDSVAMMRRDYPEVRLVCLPQNLGLTGGVNAGIRDARGEIIVLFNNDTEADERWLEELAAALDAHPEAGMAATKMRLFDLRNVIHSAGDYYRTDGIPGNRGVWEEDTGQYDSDVWVFGPCGGAAAYRRALLDEIGLFDEDLFMYCEDVDMAWRAQLAGYRCIFAPKAIIYHRLSATGGGKIASFHTGRNTIYVIAKDYPGDLLRRHWRDIIRAQWKIAREALAAWRGEAARARLRGILAGIGRIPLALRKRRVVQAARRVPTEELEGMLVPVKARKQESV
jgi:GT2 family glycosyltransferase